MPRIQFAALVILLAGISVSATAADRKPTPSKIPLSTEQMEVYRAFFNSYTNGSKSSRLNLANRTHPLDLAEQTGPNGCLKGIDFDEAKYPDSAFHKFDAQTALPKYIVLVDPDKQSTAIKENDPNRTMRQGTPVKDALDAAFASALLTLSEVAFDKTHRYAVMSFSFVCGALCGHGETIIFQMVDGRWKRTERRCGGWVSLVHNGKGHAAFATWPLFKPATTYSPTNRVARAPPPARTRPSANSASFHPKALLTSQCSSVTDREVHGCICFLLLAGGGARPTFLHNTLYAGS